MLKIKVGFNYVCMCIQFFFLKIYLIFFFLMLINILFLGNTITDILTLLFISKVNKSSNVFT